MSRKAKTIWAVRIYLIVQYSTAPNFREKGGIAPNGQNQAIEVQDNFWSLVFESELQT